MYTRETTAAMNYLAVHPCPCPCPINMTRGMMNYITHERPDLIMQLPEDEKDNRYWVYIKES